MDSNVHNKGSRKHSVEENPQAPDNNPSSSRPGPSNEGNLIPANAAPKWGYGEEFDLIPIEDHSVTVEKRPRHNEPATTYADLPPVTADPQLGYLSNTAGTDPKSTEKEPLDLALEHVPIYISSDEEGSAAAQPEEEKPITPDIHPGCSYANTPEPSSPLSPPWANLTSPKTPEGHPKTPGSPTLSQDSLSSIGTISTVFSADLDEALEMLDGPMPDLPNPDEPALPMLPEGSPSISPMASSSSSSESSHPNTPNNSPPYSPRDPPYLGNGAATPNSVRSIFSPRRRNGFSPGTDASPLSEDEDEEDSL